MLNIKQNPQNTNYTLGVWAHYSTIINTNDKDVKF